MVKEAYQNRKVIWSACNPKPQGTERFRIVDCGPPRADTKDVQYKLEQSRGHDAMGVNAWARVAEAAQIWALHTLTHALGSLLTVDVGQLHPSHPLYCEQNMAVVEGRISRGCDCSFPNDPLSRGCA